MKFEPTSVLILVMTSSHLDHDVERHSQLWMQIALREGANHRKRLIAPSHLIQRGGPGDRWLAPIHGKSAFPLTEQQERLRDTRHHGGIEALCTFVRSH